APREVPPGFGKEGRGMEFYGAEGRLGGRGRFPPRPGRRSTRGEVTLHLAFQPGELVVHVDHGIARFAGMRLIDAEDVELGGTIQREYLELEYAEGDKLFVPVESLDRVQKYLGGSE